MNLLLGLIKLPFQYISRKVYEFNYGDGDTALRILLDNIK